MMTMLTMTSPVGELRLLGDASVLTGLYILAPGSKSQALHLGLAPGSKSRALALGPEQAAPPATLGTTPLLARAAAQLAAYFAGERHTFDLPLAPAGTPFQHRVWDALLDIPYGEVRSYGELARALGRPAASRAVGFANSKNPISIIVPCHRVIGARGALTGYAGGMTAKAWLLEHERRLAVTGALHERC